MGYVVRLSGIDSSMTFQSEHTIGDKQHSNYLRVDQTLEFRGIDIVCVMVISSRVTLFQMSLSVTRKCKTSPLPRPLFSSTLCSPHITTGWYLEVGQGRSTRLDLLRSLHIIYVNMGMNVIRSFFIKVPR